MAELGGQKVQCVGGAERWDRFSDLPEHLVFHIFSFLDFDDIARVGVASKRCWHFFVCSPYLKFKSVCKYFFERGPKQNNSEQFSDAVNRLLNLRHELELRSLCLHWLCNSWGCRNEKCNLNLHLCYKWITSALGCGLQKLDLQFGKHSDGHHGDTIEFEMPHCAFDSNLLRVIKLNLNGNRLKAPAGVFASLEELSLQEISISNSDLEKWACTACPSLKRLHVEDPNVDEHEMIIVNPYIEELTFAVHHWADAILISAERLLKLSVYLDNIDASGLDVKIDAPSVNDLSWTGLCHNVTDISDFTNLQKANISVDVDIDYESENEDNVTDHLVALVDSSICYARVLQINIDSLEYLFVHNILDFDAENLVHLAVTVDNRLKACHFTVLAFFLLGSPDLETLSIKCKDDKNKRQQIYAEKLRKKASLCYKKYEGFEDINLQKLKEIEIEIEGKGHRLDLVERMIKIAKGLKKLTIIYPRGNERMVQKFVPSSEAIHLPFNVYLIPR